MGCWSGKIELSDREMEYVIDLKQTGLYGSSLDEVVRELILRSLRDAVERKLIQARKS